MATLTRKESERLDRLRERAAYLQERTVHRQDGYLVAELSALRWVIEFVEETEDFDD
jgi:hypothetical protein